MDVLEKMMPKIIDGYCARSDKPREVAENECKEYLKVIEDASAYMFNYSHSISYCLLGYYYGYFRHYYPYEFITAYLNNAANDDDIQTGTSYAGKIGIRVTMPKWGISKSDYSFDKEQGVIAKGLSSIKFMSNGLAEELYEIAHKQQYTHFVEVLKELNSNSSINSRQLDILIKLDFFSEFGNQRELLRITELFYEMFKKGEAKKISRDVIDGTQLEPIVKKYAVGVTKAGGIAKFYTLLDIDSVLCEVEDAVKAVNMPDLSDTMKVQNFAEAMGYAGYVSGRAEDRRKLYVMDVFELKRKSDGKQFGYSIITKSIGSGKEARFTVPNYVFNKEPIKKGDIIYCKSFEKNGEYFRLTSYTVVY